MEAAIEQAVANEQPAYLKVGTADMTGFSGTFGSNTDDTNTGDNQDYPMDNQLRVLQAVSPAGRSVIATLVNYSTHATVYGPRDQVAPDWPGSTATYLEGDEQDMPAGAELRLSRLDGDRDRRRDGPHLARRGFPPATPILGVRPVDQEKNLAPDGQGHEQLGGRRRTATRWPRRRSTRCQAATASTSGSRWSTGR